MPVLRHDGFYPVNAMRLRGYIAVVSFFCGVLRHLDGENRRRTGGIESSYAFSSIGDAEYETIMATKNATGIYGEDV